MKPATILIFERRKTSACFHPFLGRRSSARADARLTTSPGYLRRYFSRDICLQFAREDLKL